MTADTDGAARRPARRVALSLALAMAAAAAFRMAFAEQVFRPSGVELTGDDDPAYHVLRAERMARGAPGAPWFDPALNYPDGAEIPWPPLFDALIVGGARLASPSQVPPRSTFVVVAALLPVLLAVATVPIVRSLASALLGGDGLAAAWIFALLPGHAMLSRAGRGDQHVLELLVASAIFLLATRALADPGRTRRWAVGGLAAAFVAAFWTWTGSSLYLLLLAAFGGGWFALAGARDAMGRFLDDLRDGSALGALALAATVLATRGAGALAALSLSGVTGFQVVQLLLVAAFAAALSAASRRPAASGTLARRIAVAAAAAVIPLALAFLSQAFRDSVGHGLAGLAHASAWYRSIEEFDPILFAGYEPWQRELAAVFAMYGLGIAAMPFAGIAVARRFRSAGSRPAALAFALCWGVVMLALALARKRFALYLSVPLALWVGSLAEIAAGRVAGALRRPWIRPLACAAAISIVLAPAASGLDRTFAAEDPSHSALRRLLADLPGDAIPSERPAVMAPWAVGHLVQYSAGRPVVASPFGIEGGAGALEDGAAFFLARDAREAAALLSRRRVGVVVLGDPTSEVYFAEAFVPAGARQPVSVTTSIHGYRAVLNPEFRDLVVTRLWFDDGVATDAVPALGTFRLVDEVSPVVLGRPPAPPLKAFGVVPGAALRVRTSAPGVAVRALVNVRTGEGREFPWSTWAIADERCEAVLRVPYETGANGRTTASPAVVNDGTRTEPVVVARDAVASGREIEVAMARSCARGAIARHAGGR